MLKSKSRPFNLRLPEAQREFLAVAARREDRSLANFMIRAAMTVAGRLQLQPEPRSEVLR
jgi:uncharacterized protein (DUF1778 family)